MTKVKAQISNECQMTNAKKYVTVQGFKVPWFKVDELVKSRKTPFCVIPAKAGIQFFQLVTEFLDSGFHRSDDFLRNHQG
jgi:hypothetical protein